MTPFFTYLRERIGSFFSNSTEDRRKLEVYVGDDRSMAAVLAGFNYLPDEAPAFASRLNIELFFDASNYDINSNDTYNPDAHFLKVTYNDHVLVLNSSCGGVAECGTNNFLDLLNEMIFDGDYSTVCQSEYEPLDASGKFPLWGVALVGFAAACALVGIITLLWCRSRKKKPRNESDAVTNSEIPEQYRRGSGVPLTINE